MNRQTVTLCMIARDEESAIGMTIKSVLALVDEVIVVDTGSRDNTRIIAEGYGARVMEMPWTDDFAAAVEFYCGLASLRKTKREAYILESAGKSTTTAQASCFGWKSAKTA